MFFDRCKYCVKEMLETDKNKTNNSTNVNTINYVKIICHERQCFLNEHSIEKHDNIEDQMLQEKNKSLTGYPKRRERIDQVESTAKENLKYYLTFDGYRRLVQELLDTYLDLWYQSTSPNGYIFYSQLYKALSGVEKLGVF